MPSPEVPLLLLLLACSTGSVTLTSPDSAPPSETADSSETGDSGVAKPLPERIEGERLVGHLEALQAIADAHQGTRVAYGPGYEESLQYVVDQLEDAGYQVTRQDFTQTVEQVTTAELTLGDQSLTYDEDFALFQGSGQGSASGPVVAVDLTLPPGDAPNTSTSGCEAQDFDGFPEGAVALIQRGSCNFADKVQLAQDAGAVAVLIFNEGQAGRRDVVQGTLGGQADVPVLGLDFATGQALAEQAPVRADLTLVIEEVQRRDQNLLAATSGGDPRHQLMVGAHLDSVAAGPGINDNGTGTAAVLEIALQLAEADPSLERQVVFAFWGAEELGLVGSFAWLQQASPEELAAVDAYLNFDMLGSPNGVGFLYDGDGSAPPSQWDHPQGQPAGSDAIEALFLDWYGDLELPPVALGVPSDSYGFVSVGIPTGGLFSGAMEGKTGSEAQSWGGQAGQPYDACYHQSCDALENVDPELLLTLAQGAAHAVEQLALSDAPLAQRATAHQPTLEALPPLSRRIEPHTHGHACGLPPSTR